jgi:hypothetical protein
MMRRVRSAKSGLQPLHVAFLGFEATDKPDLGSRAAPVCAARSHRCYLDPMKEQGHPLCATKKLAVVIMRWP